MSDAPIIRYLSPAETAKALGVTVRALRVYEQRGLVRPLRSRAGWRVYGPEALTRLHQVLTLKRLGLSLAKIAVMISGRLSTLDAVLELQEQVLAARWEEAARGLELIRSARARIARGQALSLDDLTTLTRETTLNDQIPDWAKKMQPIIDRHLSAEEKVAMFERADVFDPEKVNAEWAELIAQAKALLGTDPGAPEAQELARRWSAQVLRATGGDRAITAKMGQAWRDSFANPEVAPALPFGPEVWAFVAEAAARLTPKS
jgi:MerR family transcriptional regulator, thiopeptide resistance regulator